MLLFLVTQCLVLAVQPCMEWITIKKTKNKKKRQRFTCIITIETVMCIMHCKISTCMIATETHTCIISIKMVTYIFAAEIYFTCINTAGTSNCIIATETVTCIIATKRFTNINVAESMTNIIAIEPQKLYNCNRCWLLHNCYRKCQLHSPIRICHQQNWLQKISWNGRNGTSQRPF